MGRKICLILLLAVVFMGTALNTSASTYQEALVWMELRFRYEGKLNPADLVVKKVDFRHVQAHAPESQPMWVYGSRHIEPVDFDEEPVLGFPISFDEILDHRLLVSPILYFVTEEAPFTERRGCTIEITAQAHRKGNVAEWRDPSWRLLGFDGDGDCRAELMTHLDKNLIIATIIVFD